MRKYFPIYEEAVIVMYDFATALFWISLYMRKIWFFISVAGRSGTFKYNILIFLMKFYKGGEETALYVRWGIPVLRDQLPAREGRRVQDHQGLHQEPSLPVHRVGTSE